MLIKQLKLLSIAWLHDAHALSSTSKDEGTNE